jgi:hypothetical protein
MRAIQEKKTIYILPNNCYYMLIQWQSKPDFFYELVFVLIGSFLALFYYYHLYIPLVKT